MNCDNKYIRLNMQIYKSVTTFHQISPCFTGSRYKHIKKAIPFNGMTYYTYSQTYSI